MILLTNGDSWTQGDSSPQIPNWEATKTLDWYDIIPNFGDTTINKKQSILYKFYDSPLWPKVLGEKLGFETWNAGRLGTSNDNIFRTTINSINYLEPLGKKDIFVVIAFTSLIRYEIFQPYLKPIEILEFGFVLSAFTACSPMSITSEQSTISNNESEILYDLS